MSAFRTAIYARVSTSHHGQDPQIQVNELRRYCEARGWLVTHEIVDHGFSGGTDARPGLKKLIALARARDVDCVVVLKLDRLFRSVKHLLTVLDEFAALKIQFVAVRDQIDYGTAAGKLFVQILASLAEFEKSLIRERTMLGLAHAKAKGKRLGRPRIGREEEIRRLRERGLSYRQISAQLGVSRGTVERALSVPKPNTSGEGVPKTPLTPKEKT